VVDTGQYWLIEFFLSFYFSQVFFEENQHFLLHTIV